MYAPPRNDSRLSARIKAMHWECDGVLRVELIPMEGRFAVPEPGAHIDLVPDGGPMRQYSLTVGSGEEVYILGVLHAPAGRGGSRFVHERLRVGDVVQVSAPRNSFPLVAGVGPTVLIAGGIGITPLLAMACKLSEDGRDATLLHFVRSAGHAAFRAEVEALGGRVICDDVAGLPDLATHLVDVPDAAQLYCCGPAPMLEAFLAATAARDPDHVHIERFGQEAPEPGAGEILVELARSGETVLVGPDTSILDALIAAGHEPAHSCGVGVCGTCECRVLDGDVDHRDMILTPQERADGAILICCSRATSNRLTLDL